MSDQIQPRSRMDDIVTIALHAALTGKPESSCPFLPGFERDIWIKTFWRANADMMVPA